MLDPPALGHVHEGWRHLRLQRPLAAWASWQRALRLDPADRAASKALETLETATELPAAARSVYRFQTPPDPDSRRRWDARLQVGGLDDLEAAALAFSDLTRDEPTDALAWLNRALCLAWLGRNAEAIADLDRVVELSAVSDPHRAVDAWTIAEVLRLGAGAEPLADDLRHVWVVEWPPGAGPPDAFFEQWPDLQPVAMPEDPITGGRVLADGRVFEWLDRPLPPPGAATTGGDELHRVLATVILTPMSLRLSTPDLSGFDRLEEPRFRAVARLLASARREATPLPLAWADAALSCLRLPAGLPDEVRDEQARAGVERYFEGRWTHLPRHGLDGATPLEASRGDARARARLEAVVRFREQLGVRPTHARIYQGYPFDRLRRRLGLIGPDASSAFEADDPSCMSEAELDRLDPSALNPVRLGDALLAALDFRDDRRTARFAVEWLGRTDRIPSGVDLRSAVAALVRESLRAEGADLALGWLDQAARRTDDVACSRAFRVWRAEVLARVDRPDEALEQYLRLLDDVEEAEVAAVAEDGAETLVDSGHAEEAEALRQAARARPGTRPAP